MTTKELISRYDIFDPQNGNGTIGIRNKDAVMRDNAIDEIKARKAEIIAYFAAERKAEADAKAERESRIAQIDGLAEIKAAIADLEKWNSEFERSFEGANACGGFGVRSKPDVDIDALKQKHPRAAAYLRAEEEVYSGNYEVAEIGRKALEEVIYGDYEKAMDEMGKDIKAYVDRRIWD